MHAHSAALRAFTPPRTHSQVHLLPGAAKRLALLAQLGYLEPADEDEVEADEVAEEGDEATAEGGGEAAAVEQQRHGAAEGAAEEGAPSEGGASSAVRSPSRRAPPARFVLTIKGRVACELTTAADELVLSEAVCTGLLAPLAVPELAGVLSAFVAKGKLPRGQALPAGLQSAKDALVGVATRTAGLQQAAGVLEAGSVAEHVGASINGALMLAAYHWAAGLPFEEVCGHTMCAEGDIVRILARMEELCKEVRAAARLLGDALLARKLGEVLAAIKRDIVATPSLYHTG